MAVFYTIGHSNRAIGAFIAMLQQVDVDLLIDVRTIPKSRFNPQFNESALARSLEGVGIAYRRIPELGGLRHRRKDAGPSPNGFWENENFRNYADYTATAEFRAGLAGLRELGAAHICAIMCAEAVWWRCHRQIIADYLIAAGDTVVHIMGEGKLEPARIHEAAVPGADGVLTYPASQGDLAL
jgi:uncharacterized protein (DUF488 family)